MELAPVLGVLGESGQWIPRTKAGTPVRHWANAVENLREALKADEDVTRIFQIPITERIFNDAEFRSIKFDSSGAVSLNVTIANPSPAPAVAKAAAGKKDKVASSKKAREKKSKAEANKPPK